MCNDEEDGVLLMLRGAVKAEATERTVESAKKDRIIVVLSIVVYW